MKEKTVEKKPLLARFMDGVETVCNKLPPPTMLFVFLFFIVAILGTIFTFLGTSLTNPATGEIVMSKNFFSKEGLLWFLDNMVKNFTGFAPLGLVLTMTIGTGICEEAGMLNSLLRSSMKNVPAALVPYVCVLIGIIGNLASDAASVMVPPLAAMAFMGVGKHPVAGMICGYIGAQVGYAANPVISGTDTLLMGITNDTLASFMGDSAFTVDVTCNWIFKIASTVLCVVVIGILVQKIVEPRFGVYHGELEKMEDLTPSEKKGLRASGISTLVYVACLLVLFFTGVIAAEDGGLIGSPFLKDLIPIIFLLFVIAGVSYGYASGNFKGLVDIHKAIVKQMAAMGTYVGFCFFCGQFQGLFSWHQPGSHVRHCRRRFPGKHRLYGDPHVHRLHYPRNPGGRILQLRLCKMGDLRSDLRSHVPAAGLPSRLYPDHLPSGRLRWKPLRPHLRLSLDAFKRGPGQVR